MNRIKDLINKHGLLIATHNQGKLREIQELVHPLGIICTSAKHKDLPEPEEDGFTFTENAMIKSVAAAKATNMPCLADDSGLCVPALDGDPGIYSARWAGPDKDFGYAMNSVRTALQAKGKPLDSPAYFVCMFSLALPHGLDVGEVLPKETPKFTIHTHQAKHISCINIEGRAYGRLTFPPRGQQGFGYDPIFIPEGMEQTFAEIPSEQKQRISHRFHAFEGLMHVLGE